MNMLFYVCVGCWVDDGGDYDIRDRMLFFVVGLWLEVVG